MQIVRKYALGIFVLLLLIAASGMIYKKLHPKKLPANLIEATGRIDGDVVNLNAKYPGHIVKIFVDDSDAVHKGMKIALLQSDELQAQKAGVAAQISAKKRELAAKKIELEIAKKTIPLQLKEAQERQKSAQAAYNALAQKLSIQKDLLEQAKRDFERSKKLYKQKSIDKHAFELANLKLSTERKKLAAMQQQLQQAQAALNLAHIAVQNATAAQKKLAAMQAGVEVLEEGIEALEASKKQIEAMIAEMTLRSSVDGVTVERIANEGEVIAAGMSVVTLLDPHSLYLKIFVDTMQNGKIKVGDKAEIFLDAYPNHPIAAKVVRIAQKAEFTPKEVSVRSDRIQRVFAVHLKPLKVDPLLKLGIPAVGVISLDGKDLPSSLDEIPEI
jgi:HlyD family secretion protein